MEDISFVKIQQDKQEQGLLCAASKSGCDLNVSNKLWERRMAEALQHSGIMHRSNSLYHRIKFLDRNEVKSIAELFFKNDMEKTEEYLIALMVSKLAYPNRLCFGYQYELQEGQKTEIEPLELDDPNMDTYNHKELVRRIQSIRYNCCSNGGSEFIPKDIEEKLDIILIICAGILAKED